MYASCRPERRTPSSVIAIISAFDIGIVSQRAWAES
jgi:hypothetical protein